MFNNFLHDKNYAVAADVNGPAFSAKGGMYVLGAFGTFGGGTVKVQFATDTDTTWIDLGSQNGVATLLSAAGTSAFRLAPGRYRVIVLGSTAPTLQYFFAEANGE